MSETPPPTRPKSESSNKEERLEASPAPSSPNSSYASSQHSQYYHLQQHQLLHQKQQQQHSHQTQQPKPQHLLEQTEQQTHHRHFEHNQHQRQRKQEQQPNKQPKIQQLADKDNHSQQFCLRWNNYQANLTSVFDQLLQSESFVDVTLSCDGHSIKAHKIVLSACSPYFQSLFVDNPCQHPIIIMRDVKWPELKAAVEFMYKGEINVNQDQIGPLLRVAEMLKIRGLNDVNGDQKFNASPQTINLPAHMSSTRVGQENSAQDRTSKADNNTNAKQHAASEFSESSSAKKSRISTPPKEWYTMAAAAAAASANHASSISMVNVLNAAANIDVNCKRRWSSTENNSIDTGSHMNTTSSDHLNSHLPVPSNMEPVLSVSHQPTILTPSTSFQIPSSLDALSQTALAIAYADDTEIKPEIAEMIREEEKAKLLENSHAWLGASTSAAIADSYQYQLQSMWQEFWNTNQNLNHHLRFRERGPLKSWRPETMAEAIFSVLKDSLSLSQAARKYDIPYPTFVLYANRVHNMLGPSIDGCVDLRPKGRGRPQRILLGIWPDDHINGVIRTVVFRDAKVFKEESMHLSYGRHSPVYPFPD